MAKGSAWMTIFKFIEKSISVVSTIILARLLTKEDFGIAAIAMIVIALLDLFRAFGFEMALIQNQESTREHYDTVWSFNIISSILLAIVLIVFSPNIAKFYNDNRLLEIMPLLAIGVFVSGFYNVGIVNYRKELEFHKDFIFLLSRKLITFVAAISLAFYFRNYWALIGAFVFSNIAVVILSYFIHEYRPRFSLKQTKDLFSFSGWIFINNLLGFALQKLPELLIGKLVGIGSLGIFSLTHEITLTTSGTIVFAVNRATLPGYSKLSNNYAALKASLLNTLGLLSVIIIPASIGLSAIAPIMVPVLLGDKWLESIQIMEILAYSGLLFNIANLTSIYLAIGKPKINTFIKAARILVYIPILILSIPYFGLQGVAWSLLITSIIMLPIYYWPAMKIIDIKLAELVSIFIRPIIASIVMLIVLKFIFSGYIVNTNLTHNIFELIYFILTGIFTYTIILIMLWHISGRPIGSERHIIDIVRRKLVTQNI